VNRNNHGAYARRNSRFRDAKPTAVQAAPETKPDPFAEVIEASTSGAPLRFIPGRRRATEPNDGFSSRGGAPGPKGPPTVDLIEQARRRRRGQL
jgi:hypothetical protein